MNKVIKITERNYKNFSKVKLMVGVYCEVMWKHIKTTSNKIFFVEAWSINLKSRQ